MKTIVAVDLAVAAENNDCRRRHRVWSALFLTAPLLMFLNPRVFGLLGEIVNRYHLMGRKLFESNGWLTQIHIKLRQIDVHILMLSVVFTIASNVVFFLQSYLLAKSLSIDISVFEAAAAVTLSCIGSEVVRHKVR